MTTDKEVQSVENASGAVSTMPTSSLISNSTSVTDDSDEDDYVSDDRALSRISKGPKTGPIPNCNFFKIMQNSQILHLTPAIFIPKCPISFPNFAKKAPSQKTWIKPWMKIMIMKIIPWQNLTLIPNWIILTELKEQLVHFQNSRIKIDRIESDI